MLLLFVRSIGLDAKSNKKIKANLPQSGTPPDLPGSRTSYITTGSYHREVPSHSSEGDITSRKYPLPSR